MRIHAELDNTLHVKRIMAVSARAMHVLRTAPCYPPAMAPTNTTFRFNDDDLAKLDELAELLGVQRTDAIRLAVGHMLRTYPLTHDQLRELVAPFVTQLMREERRKRLAATPRTKPKRRRRSTPV